MYIEPQKFTLKDGREAVVRCAEAADGAECLMLMRQAAQETEHLLRLPEEWDGFTDEAEAVFLRARLADENALQLVCEVAGKVVGTASLDRHVFIKTRHRADVGIAILREYWNLGIGRALFGMLFLQAERWGLTQLELEVVDANERGIALYRKLGFEVYGERPDGVILPDGRRMRDYLMVKKMQ